VQNNSGERFEELLAFAQGNTDKLPEELRNALVKEAELQDAFSTLLLMHESSGWGVAERMDELLGLVSEARAKDFSTPSLTENQLLEIVGARRPGDQKSGLRERLAGWLRSPAGLVPVGGGALAAAAIIVLVMFVMPPRDTGRKVRLAMHEDVAEQTSGGHGPEPWVSVRARFAATPELVVTVPELSVPGPQAALLGLDAESGGLGLTGYATSSDRELLAFRVGWRLVALASVEWSGRSTRAGAVLGGRLRREVRTLELKDRFEAAFSGLMDALRQAEPAGAGVFLREADEWHWLLDLLAESLSEREQVCMYMGVFYGTAVLDSNLLGGDLEAVATLSSFEGAMDDVGYDGKLRTSLREVGGLLGQGKRSEAVTLMVEAMLW